MSYVIETDLPPLHRNWDIKDMVGADNVLEVQQQVVKYVNDPDVIKRGNNLFIFSRENGTGKTRTAFFIAYKLHEPRLGPDGQPVIIPVASISFGEYLKFCEDRFSADSKEARKYIMTVPILLLDDVSPVYGTGNLPFDRKELLLLMEYRRRHLLLTIITSNHNPDSFHKLYGQTALSKVLENFSYIEIIGGDVRQAIYPDQLQTLETEDEEACR